MSRPAYLRNRDALYRAASSGTGLRNVPYTCGIGWRLAVVIQWLLHALNYSKYFVIR